jgi:hypothetical protein
MATGGMLKKSLDPLEVATKDVVANMEVSQMVAVEDVVAGMEVSQSQM